MARLINRGNGPPILAGLLSIVGIGMAAATLNTATGGGGSGRFYQPPEPGAGTFNRSPQQINVSGNGSGSGTSPAQSSIQLSTCIDVLNSPLGIALVVLAFALIVGAIYYRYSFSLALLSGWTIGPPVVLVYALLTNCIEGSPGGVPEGGGISGPNVGETPFGIESVPPWVMGVVLGGVLIGAVALLYMSTQEEETVIPEEEGADEENELDRFAEAAGRAADRIEEHNADVDNAVYRAWLEMTGALDVERPETYSAGEFADEAIELGMAEEDVQELTTLFNEVRYGGKDAATREDRAVAVLRNIEEQYGQRLDTGAADDGVTGAGEDASRTDEEQDDDQEKR